MVCIDTLPGLADWERTSAWCKGSCSGYSCCAYSRIKGLRFRTTEGGGENNGSRGLIYAFH